jgi:tetratricopeptide (TPR) repeat protein
MRWLGGLVLIFALGGVAFAQPQQSPTEIEAKKLYDQGTQHYNLNEYAEAIKSYKEAYRLLPNPYFLYNIAQAYRLNNEPRQAVAFYKNFLNALPNAPNVAEVRGHISELEAAIRKQEEANKANPTGTVLPTAAEVAAQAEEKRRLQLEAGGDREPSRPIYKKWWFWGGLGVVVVGASVTAIMLSSDGPPGSDLGNFPVF